MIRVVVGCEGSCDLHAIYTGNLDQLRAWVSETAPDRAPRHAFGVMQPEDEAITAIAGSSGWFDMAIVSYSNDAKQRLLGVPPQLLLQHGAVSEPVAAAMAEGIRDRAGVQVGVGITKYVVQLVVGFIIPVEDTGNPTKL